MHLNDFILFFSSVGSSFSWVMEQCFPGFSESLNLSSMSSLRMQRSLYTGLARTSMFFHISGYWSASLFATSFSCFSFSSAYSRSIWNISFTLLFWRVNLIFSTSSSFGDMYLVPSTFSLVVLVLVVPSSYPIWESITFTVNVLSFFWLALRSSSSFRFMYFEMAF